MLGLTAGSMSMEGGHGNAAAYGKTLEESFNIDSAITAALAAATLELSIWWISWWTFSKGTY